MLHGMQPINTSHFEAIGSAKWYMVFRATMTAFLGLCCYPLLMHAQARELLSSANVGDINVYCLSNGYGGTSMPHQGQPMLDSELK